MGGQIRLPAIVIKRDFYEAPEYDKTRWPGGILAVVRHIAKKVHRQGRESDMSHLSLVSPDPPHPTQPPQLSRFSENFPTHYTVHTIHIFESSYLDPDPHYGLWEILLDSDPHGRCGYPDPRGQNRQNMLEKCWKIELKLHSLDSDPHKGWFGSRTRINFVIQITVEKTIGKSLKLPSLPALETNKKDIFLN